MLEARLEEEHVRLRNLHETLVQDQSARGDGDEARRHARDVNRHIIKDEGDDNPPVFSTASQNVMAAALLLRARPEPSTPEGRTVAPGATWPPGASCGVERREFCITVPRHETPRGLTPS